MPTALQHPDDLHLRAAQGWLELGNPAEAEAELTRLSAANVQHPDVLELRWHLYAQTQDWPACIEVAEKLIDLDPTRADAWIHRSFALHELKRTQDAFDRLVTVADHFTDIWTIPYNLACYCSQLGRLEAAQQWLNKAKSIDAVTVTKAAAEAETRQCASRADPCQRHACQRPAKR